MTPAELIALRRALHRVPELGFAEHTTQELLQKRLSLYASMRPIAGTGLVTDLGEPEAPTTLLLRADMDGLPIQEETGLAYSSQHAGLMHACGHDAHMAALVAAGEALAERKLQNVRLRLLFQPAEEGGGGAQRCIEEGVLDGVDLAFGIHVWNELPVGSIALSPGGIMAGVAELTINIQGKGGHGAIPDRARDPIVAAAQLVLALQTIASRRSSPFDPTVVTIGSVQAGEAFNVIPDSALLRGTVRTFSVAEARKVEEQVHRICKGIGDATDTVITLDWLHVTKPTVNSPDMSQLVSRACKRVPGITTLHDTYQTMAGEDFGDILAKVPGCFVLLGSANPEAGLSEPHHSPRFAIDERVLELACALHIAVAEEVATLTHARDHEGSTRKLDDQR